MRLIAQSTQVFNTRSGCYFLLSQEILKPLYRHWLVRWVDWLNSYHGLATTRDNDFLAGLSPWAINSLKCALASAIL